MAMPGILHVFSIIFVTPPPIYIPPLSLLSNPYNALSVFFLSSKGILQLVRISEALTFQQISFKTCPIVVVALPLQMASCVYLFIQLGEGTVWEKLLSTVRIDEGEIRVLSGLG